MRVDIRNKELRVSQFLATKKGDPDRGPAVFLNRVDAANRLLNEGELAWIYGPRRHELATVILDEQVKAGDVWLRDIAGVAASETVRVVKPDLDSRGRSALA